LSRPRSSEGVSEADSFSLVKTSFSLLWPEMEESEGKPLNGFDQIIWPWSL
jgi:hypothetical protein